MESIAVEIRRRPLCSSATAIEARAAGRILRLRRRPALPLPRARTLEIRGFVALARHALQAGVLQNHAERAAAPDVRGDDRDEREARGREQGQRSRSNAAQIVINDARTVLDQQNLPDD